MSRKLPCHKPDPKYPVIFFIINQPSCHLLHSLQDTEAALQQARAESEGRLAAMRKGLLAAEDAERAELEKEYK